MLSTLVDKSLIWRESGGRYQMHELLRQYAAERLAVEAEAVRQVQQAHARYYMSFLQRREFELHFDRQRETVRELEMEMDNLRAALRWAIESADPLLLRTGAWPYYDLMDIQGRYHEACQTLVQAIDHLAVLDSSEERDFTLAILRCAAANLCIRAGQFEEARTLFYESARLFGTLNRPPPPGFGTEPLIGMGLLATTIGRF
ncbi:MAG: hypothetical protein IPK19_27335 [Chloroflexi bacterium]|nr:hypothetical protein [Chloroflexota bacterium]